ncbi:MAG TPA: hypothetical protein VL832_06520 [Puia sp.]|nr:hypothetical protein [Puia sp.]
MRKMAGPAPLMTPKKYLIRVPAAAFLLAVSIILFSFVVSDKLSDDLWKQLGISQQDCSEKIKKSFLDNYLHHEGLSNLKNIALNDRPALAKGLLAYTRQYVNSPAFKAAYEKTRQEMKSSEPSGNQRSKEEIRQQMITDIKDALKRMESIMKTLPADQQKALQPVLDLRRKNLEEYAKPESKEIEIMYEAQVSQRKREMEQYEQNLKNWERDYPADYRGYIKTRLQNYLDLAKTVDFSATVTEVNGKKRFDNKDYQYKSNDWKMIYRAGKEVYEATKAFAEQWVQELP